MIVREYQSALGVDDHAGTQALGFPHHRLVRYIEKLPEKRIGKKRVLSELYAPFRGNVDHCGCDVFQHRGEAGQFLISRLGRQCRTAQSSDIQHDQGGTYQDKTCSFSFHADS